MGSLGQDALASTRVRRRRLPRSLARLRTAVQEGLHTVLLAPVYRLYTDRLHRQVRRGPLPVHLAVILDGNRRWASRAGFAHLAAGHRRGADKIDELLDWC